MDVLWLIMMMTKYTGMYLKLTNTVRKKNVDGAIVDAAVAWNANGKMINIQSIKQIQ